MRRMKEEHIVKNARCGNTREKKKRAANPKVKRCVYRGEDERGQHDTQGSMEEYHHQLYRRPQMMGQAKVKEVVTL